MLGGPVIHFSNHGKLKLSNQERHKTRLLLSTRIFRDEALWPQGANWKGSCRLRQTSSSHSGTLLGLNGVDQRFHVNGKCGTVQ